MLCAYAGYSASKQNIEKIAVISNDKEYSSIISVIKSINSNVEIAFECCIYNVIYELYVFRKTTTNIRH